MIKLKAELFFDQWLVPTLEHIGKIAIDFQSKKKIAKIVKEIKVFSSDIIDEYNFLILHFGQKIKTENGEQARLEPSVLKYQNPEKYNEYQKELAEIKSKFIEIDVDKFTVNCFKKDLKDLQTNALIVIDDILDINDVDDVGEGE